MKENQVNLVRTLSILSTTLSTPNDDFAAFASAPVNPVTEKMNEILKRRRDEAQNEATEKAASEILALVEDSDTKINLHRNAVAEARRQVAANTNRIEIIAVTRRYGEKTMNWIPLAVALGKIDIANAISYAAAGTLVTVPTEEAKALLAEIKAEQAVIQEQKAAAHAVKTTPTGKTVPVKRARKVAAK